MRVHDLFLISFSDGTQENVGPETVQKSPVKATVKQITVH